MAASQGLTRRDFLKRTGTAALVGMVSTGPFFLKGRKAYGAEATIEDLTKGKIHVGDTISKENIHLVRNLITESAYERAMRGCVFEIAPKTPKNDVRNPSYWEVTARNKGLAVIDKDKNLLTKDGKPCPGGFPSLSPKTL